jgi:uncharacterized protein (TIGR00290 family)
LALPGFEDLSPISSSAPAAGGSAEPAAQDVVLYWSGGKDCAMVLHDLHSGHGEGGLRVSSLLTTFTAGYDRVSGHGIRRELIERQADAIGIPLHKTYIPQSATMDQYESVMESALLVHRQAGTLIAASGDVFVEKQRVSIFKRMGFRGCFPLWKRTTLEQVQAFIAAGFKARVVCVDSAFLDRSFVGCELDREFLARLPPGVDPCGENGEYHTFVYEGPILRQPLRHRLGEVVFRESLYFCDVLPDL